MTILNIIIFIIVLIIGLVFGYYLGYNKDKNIQIIDNTALKEEQENLQNQIYYSQSQLVSIQQQYNEQVQVIENSQEYAAQAYKLKEEKYKKQYQVFCDKIEALKLQRQEEINAINEELASLKATKAATIEAFQKERAIQEEADAYRLNISRADAADIELLRTVQERLSKPRILSMLIWQTYYQPIAKRKFNMILGSNTVSGIYKITNTKSKECYIGQARDVRKRWMDHCKAGCDIDRPLTSRLYGEMLRDGLEYFTFELLLECSPDELNQKEKYFIELYNAQEFGYNSKGGNK